jgi:hypothetical protein
MADKTSFTADEWSRVVTSPMVVGLAITAAEPSGLWGMAKEGLASGWALLDARRDPQANPLVKAVAEAFALPEARRTSQEQLQSQFKVSKVGELREKAVDELRSIAQIIDAKAPEDASAFKGWLREIAQKAAEAAKEGGFLGFGGVAVSEAEKATLAEITTALGHLTSRSDAPAPDRPSHQLEENSARNLDEKLDSASEESFPASDPVSVRITR